MDLDKLLSRVMNGDLRALARAITLVDDPLMGEKLSRKLSTFTSSE